LCASDAGFEWPLIVVLKNNNCGNKCYQNNKDNSSAQAPKSLLRPLIGDALPVFNPARAVSIMSSINNTSSLVGGGGSDALVPLMMPALDGLLWLPQTVVEQVLELMRSAIAAYDDGTQRSQAAAQAASSAAAAAGTGAAGDEEEEEAAAIMEEAAAVADVNEQLGAQEADEAAKASVELLERNNSDTKHQGCASTTITNESADDAECGRDALPVAAVATVAEAAVNSSGGGGYRKRRGGVKHRKRNEALKAKALAATAMG
jgi:hypothetical protein